MKTQKKKKVVIIGSWKMNKTFTESKEYLKTFWALYKKNKKEISKNVYFGLALPFTSLSLSNKYGKKIHFVAQNASMYRSGAYTGEVSMEMLKDLNVKAVILGHSERRIYFGETSKEINKKAKLAIEYGITPIIAVGETSEDFKMEHSADVVKNMVLESTKGLDCSKIIIAYEPLWAIGSGTNASGKYVDSMCLYIKKLFKKRVIVQYGGSVNPENVSEYLDRKHIDGLLVGGASLVPEKFISILKSYPK